MKKSFTKFSCSPVTSVSSIMMIFCRTNSSSIRRNTRKLSACCLITISVMSLTSCWAEMPPKIFSPETPDKLKRRTAAKRTRKNSSKLLEKIPINRKRSNKGTDSSAASCKTLALKASQLFSRSI